MSEVVKNNFFLDLDEIKCNIRNEVAQGFLRPDYTSVEKIIGLLNQSLATEIICTHRYKNHYYTASALGEHVIANEFLEHAREEQSHADKLAKRIAQLGGEPEYDLTFINRTSHTEYKPCSTIDEMLRENLIAERIVVSVYKEVIKFLADKDPVTKRVLEEILFVEEEHVDDLYDFLNKHEFKKQRIETLRTQAEELAMKMIADDENMLKSSRVSEPDIGKIIQELNKIDDSNYYRVSDFVPKK